MIILPRWLGGKVRLAPGVDVSQSAPVSAARHQAEEIVEFARLAIGNGNLPLALERIREAIQVDPLFARAHAEHANVLKAGGDLDGSISAALKAVELDEHSADAHFNLGRLYGLKGDSVAAEARYWKALDLRPQFAAAVIAMAALCETMGRIQESESLFRRALADDPRQEDATFGLCRLLWAQGKSDEVEGVLRRAVTLNPKFSEAFCNLGDLCRAQRRESEAMEWYTKALAVGDPAETPESKTVLAKTAFVLGNMLLHENRWEEGTVFLQRSMELMPESAAPYVNLSWMELRRARPRQAIEFLQKAIELDPAAWTPKSYRLFALNLLDDVDPQWIFAEHRRFGEWLEGIVQRKMHAYSNPIDAARALRVGYVSGDFRLHPVSQFLSPLIEEHDRAQVQPFCYSNTVGRDEVTQELERRFAGIWRDIRGLSDDEVADLVIDDEIDILVDLSGHTGDSRLAVFAQKPAPIQVAWLGYLNTTGLKSMDYRLVDRHTDPVGDADLLHTERLVRLPDSQWAYWPVFEVPIMRADPAPNSHGVLFGSFNQFTKLSDRSLELWGRIFARVPDARLRVAGLPPGSFEDLLLVRLEKVGIANARVTFTMRVPQMQYLQSFNDVDIALDSMPYNGATTTLDTLWMGVPVVGLVGPRSISRGTYSILKTLGVDELIAESPEQYVELNVRLATDEAWRKEWHRSLRDKLRRSPLTDISAFAENLEAAYRSMWREWCASHSAAPSA